MAYSAGMTADSSKANTSAASTTSAAAQAYQPARPSRTLFVPLRGLRYHVHVWGDASLIRPDRPPLVLAHGWLAFGASYQFLVDALAQADGFERWVIAPDWRGFGGTETPGADTYWFPDYPADLAQLLDALGPSGQHGLLGPSPGRHGGMLALIHM